VGTILMRASAVLVTLACGLVALACGICTNARAQQSTTSTSNETFEAVFAKGHQECAALWSDHAFDLLRQKVPLGDDKPTLSMLTNNEKLKPKDRPLADLAIKTMEKCRSLAAPAYSMLPQQLQNLFRGVERKQDALIAELYIGKITFGEYNVAMNRLTGETSEAIYGIPNSSQSNAPIVPSTSQRNAQSPLSSRTATGSEKSAPAPEKFNETRLALVIGNGDYAKLPKLSNPTNDARSATLFRSGRG